MRERERERERERGERIEDHGLRYLTIVAQLLSNLKIRKLLYKHSLLELSF